MGLSHPYFHSACYGLVIIVFSIEFNLYCYSCYECYCMYLGNMSHVAVFCSTHIAPPLSAPRCRGVCVGGGGAWDGSLDCWGGGAASNAMFWIWPWTGRELPQAATAYNNTANEDTGAVGRTLGPRGARGTRRRTRRVSRAPSESGLEA